MHFDTRNDEPPTGDEQIVQQFLDVFRTLPPNADLDEIIREWAGGDADAEEFLRFVAERVHREQIAADFRAFLARYFHDPHGVLDLLCSMMWMPSPEGWDLVIRTFLECPEVFGTMHAVPEQEDLEEAFALFPEALALWRDQRDGWTEEERDAAWRRGWDKVRE